MSIIPQTQFYDLKFPRTMHILSTKDHFLDSEKLISKYLNYNIVIVNT